MWCTDISTTYPITYIPPTTPNPAIQSIETAAVIIIYGIWSPEDTRYHCYTILALHTFVYKWFVNILLKF